MLKPRNFLGTHVYNNFTDYSGVHHTRPPREDMWIKWRETQKVNEAWRAARNDKGQHGTIPVKQIELYNELQMMEHERD